MILLALILLLISRETFSFLIKYMQIVSIWYSYEFAVTVSADNLRYVLVSLFTEIHFIMST